MRKRKEMKEDIYNWYDENIVKRLDDCVEVEPLEIVVGKIMNRAMSGLPELTRNFIAKKYFEQVREVKNLLVKNFSIFRIVGKDLEMVEKSLLLKDLGFVCKYIVPVNLTIIIIIWHYVFAYKA